MVMPISFLLQQQDQEEVQDPEAEDSQRRDVHAPEVEMERSLVPDISPPSLSPPASATASADTYGPSFTALSGVRSCQYQGASRCHGCCLFVGFYTGIDGPEMDSS